MSLPPDQQQLAQDTNAVERERFKYWQDRCVAFIISVGVLDFVTAVCLSAVAAQAATGAWIASPYNVFSLLYSAALSVLTAAWMSARHSNLAALQADP